MNRRDFANLLPFVWLSSCLPGQPQQRQGVRRIGALLPLAEDELGRSRLSEFQQGLRVLGWTAGQNVQIDVRWAGADAARVEAYAAEVMRETPDAILAVGTVSLQALMKETREIPIVFVQVTDPVEAGFVKSLSSPGGNVTGFTNFGPSVGSERLVVLKQIMPTLQRVLVVRESANFNQPRQLVAIDEKAAALGILVSGKGMADAAQLTREIADFARDPNGGLMVIQGPFTTMHRERIVSLAAEHRLPSVYPLASFVEIGGLASYGINVPAMWQASAAYVDRILRGAIPSELPVLEPAEPEIMVNLKTAKALNLTIPEALRAKLTKLIE